jgi:hypothetical protein
MRTFFEILGCTAETATAHPSVKYWSQQKKVLEIWCDQPGGNYSTLFFLYLDGEKAVQNIQSMNLSFAGIDQAEQVSPAAFEEFDGRVRHGNCPHWIATVGNPAGHNWIWKRYFKWDPVGKTGFRGDPDWIMWIASTMENPYLPDDFVPNLLKNHSQDWVDRFVHGSFDVFKGQMYEEWNEQIHVIQSFDIPEDWIVGYGFDHGWVNAACFEGLAKDYDDHLIVYDELAGSETYKSDFARALKQDNRAFIDGEQIPIYGDPSAGNVGSGNADDESVLDDYRRLGINIRAAKRQRRNYGVQKIQELLKIDWTKPHPFKPGVMGAAKLYVMQHCEMLREQMPNMQWKPLKPQDEGKRSAEEEQLKVDDHAPDALRYIVTSHLAEMHEATPERPQTVTEITDQHLLKARGVQVTQGVELNYDEY